jgi:pimeloyl-ACP methyl ester carboxylesterase
MIQRFLSVLGPTGFRRMAYVERGTSGTEWPDLVCVHGLTRNSRDFDELAIILAESRRVIAADVAGRGKSDWLPHAALYDFPLYLSDMAALLARMDVESVDWVGTSMGGLIGMMLAAQPNSPIRKLVLNDVGPFLSAAGLVKIGERLANLPQSFASIEEAEAYFRQAHATFGKLSGEQWRHMTVHSVRETKDGGLALHYDPQIAQRFLLAPLVDVDLWALWEKITCPILVLRGESSDLLSLETAEEMTKRGPKATLVEIPDCGHAPSLMDNFQIAVIKSWLESGR